MKLKREIQLSKRKWRFCSSEDRKTTLLVLNQEYFRLLKVCSKFSHSFRMWLAAKSRKAHSFNTTVISAGDKLNDIFFLVFLQCFQIYSPTVQLHWRAKVRLPIIPVSEATILTRSITATILTPIIKACTAITVTNISRTVITALHRSGKG